MVTVAVKHFALSLPLRPVMNMNVILQIVEFLKEFNLMYVSKIYIKFLNHAK